MPDKSLEDIAKRAREYRVSERYESVGEILRELKGEQEKSILEVREEIVFDSHYYRAVLINGKGVIEDIKIGEREDYFSWNRNNLSGNSPVIRCCKEFISPDDKKAIFLLIQWNRPGALINSREYIFFIGSDRICMPILKRGSKRASWLGTVALNDLAQWIDSETLRVSIPYFRATESPTIEGASRIRLSEGTYDISFNHENQVYNVDRVR